MLIITKVDDFFTSLFDKLSETISWSTFVILLVGIIIGFVLASTIYGIYMLACLKKTEKSRKDKALNNVSKDLSNAIFLLSKYFH